MVIYCLVQLAKNSKAVKAIAMNEFDMETAMAKLRRAYPDHGWIGMSFERDFCKGYEPIYRWSPTGRIIE